MEKILYFCLLLTAGVGSVQNSRVSIKNLMVNEDGQSYKLHLSKDGEEHHFNLERPSESVFHDNFRTYEAYENEAGETVFEQWTPGEKVLKSVHEHLYIDQQNHAVFKLHQIKDGDHIVAGIARDFSVLHDGEFHYAKKHVNLHTDALPIPESSRNSSSTPPKGSGDNKGDATNDNIAELLIFADKDLYDFFKQDRRKTLDYFATLMYHNMLAYRTLPTAKLSFRLSGLVLNANTGAQPYIEKSRNDKGEASMNQILDDFGYWLYEKKNSNLPKYDVATLVMRTWLTWYGGLAWIGGVCSVEDRIKYNWNIFLFTDNGDWESPGFLTHESGHSMGAPHDDDDSVREECKNVTGYIMSGGGSNKQWFFSQCSDKFIRTTVEKEEKNCLRRIDNPKPTMVDFTKPPVPSMDELCKFRFKNPKAYVEKEDQANCDWLRCKSPQDDGGVATYSYNYIPDNMACDTGVFKGACFRGRCRKAGVFLKHARSKLCVVTQNQFSHWSAYILAPCPKINPSALERFVLEVVNTDTGLTIALPYSQVNDDGQHENAEKCMWTGHSEDQTTPVWSDRCGDYSNSWHGWELIEAGNSQYLIKHKITGRCMVPSLPAKSGNWILADKNCKKSDPNMKWTLS